MTQYIPANLLANTYLIKHPADSEQHSWSSLNPYICIYGSLPAKCTHVFANCMLNWLFDDWQVALGCFLERRLLINNADERGESENQQQSDRPLGKNTKLQRL